MSIRRVLVTCSAALLVTAAAGASMPVTVSPGNTDQVALIEDRCPTFSWGEVEGARSYEMVVYRLGEDGEEAQPVLRQSFPGSVESWTPSLGRCLEEGGRYAWSVRAAGGRRTPRWSVPRLFQVAAGPSQVEFEQALAVVRQYLEAHGSPVATTATSKLVADEPEARPEASARRDSRAVQPPPSTVSLVTEGAAGIGASSPLDDLHVHSSSNRVGLLLTPTGYIAGFGGTSEIVLAEDPNGSFGMKLRYDGGGNEFQILGYGGAGDTAPFLKIDHVDETLTVSDLTCDGCVGPDEIATDAVGQDQLANNSVHSGTIVNDSIRAPDLELNEKVYGPYTVTAGNCREETECCGLLAQHEYVLSGGAFDVTSYSSAILVQSAHVDTPPGPPNYSDSCWSVAMCNRGTGSFDFKIRLLCIG